MYWRRDHELGKDREKDLSGLILENKLVEQRAFKKVESEKDLLSFEGNGSTSDNSLRLVPIKWNSPPTPSTPFFLYRGLLKSVRFWSWTRKRELIFAEIRLIYEKLIHQYIVDRRTRRNERDRRHDIIYAFFNEHKFLKRNTCEAQP